MALRIPDFIDRLLLGVGQEHECQEKKQSAVSGGLCFGKLLLEV